MARVGMVRGCSMSSTRIPVKSRFQGSRASVRKMRFFNNGCKGYRIWVTKSAFHDVSYCRWNWRMFVGCEDEVDVAFPI